MLKFELDDNYPFIADVLALQDACASLYVDKEVTLYAKERLELRFADPKLKPFYLDWTQGSWQWRFKHSGKHSEAVARAVIGKLKEPVVVDATAGLGRDSLVLQNAGAQVFMFERNPLVWLFLQAARFNALQNDAFVASFPQGLPTLMPYGTYLDYARTHQDFSCEVVYYDPMFPSRQKSAQVKKDMQIFHSIVGKDEDSLSYAHSLIQLPKFRTVIKRPDSAPPLIPCDYSVDGKACHFDCYVSKKA
jgi:16S rRNA (guanine1516-N2)-methyltransferase